MDEPQDSVDALIASWSAARPELEFSPVGVLTRLARVRRHVDTELDVVFGEHGLDRGRWAVLATLARLGELPVDALMAEVGMSGAAVTGHLDELEASGFVTRGERVSLTAAGTARFEAALTAHLANERRVLSALSAQEQSLLAGLLRRLLVEFEGTRPDGLPRLGLTLAPSHMTAQLREAVGRPPVEGLLVQHVERGGLAEAAGLRTGDVLVRAGDREVRSVSALYGALQSASGRVPVAVLRDDEHVRVELDVDGLPDAASPGRAAFAEHVL